MTFKELTKEQNALVELIASFSAITGTTFSSTSDGRWFSWYDTETDTDWLNIVVDDSGVCNVLIYSSLTNDESKMYAAIGYCTFNEIPLEINEEGKEPTINEEGNKPTVNKRNIYKLHIVKEDKDND